MKSEHPSGDISGSLSPYYSPGTKRERGRQRGRDVKREERRKKTIKLCDTTCLRAVDDDVRDWEVCVYVGV